MSRLAPLVTSLSGVPLIREDRKKERLDGEVIRDPPRVNCGLHAVAVTVETGQRSMRWSSLLPLICSSPQHPHISSRPIHLHPHSASLNSVVRISRSSDYPVLSLRKSFLTHTKRRRRGRCPLFPVQFITIRTPLVK